MSSYLVTVAIMVGFFVSGYNDSVDNKKLFHKNKFNVTACIVTAPVCLGVIIFLIGKERD